MSNLQQKAIYIDEVQTRGDLLEGVDQFEIEWFETEKHLFKRMTSQGVELYLEKESKTAWQQGDLLYAGGKLIAQLVIKPATVIRFSSEKGVEIADFCFYIGNRHLPVFIDKETQFFLVPYDGNLYEQLRTKFPTQITLEKQQLLANMLLKKKYTPF